tara:strand:+ start:78 stop:836 length:759 start_codon:yes stop_codon:yes gene_type:complete
MELKMWLGVVTLFPEMFSSLKDYGVTSRATDNGLIEFEFYNPRDFAEDNYRRVDDYSYGGGPGMVMKFATLEKAVNKAKAEAPSETKVLLMSPQGTTLDQGLVNRLSAGECQSFILVCGRYEGVDERFIKKCVDVEVSIGNYVVSGGELPAMVFIDSISRQLPGVLGNPDSSCSETYVEGLLDYPHYTRPEEISDMEVPAELLSGDPLKVSEFRRRESLKKTYEQRPELLSELCLGDRDAQLLKEYFNTFVD